MARRYARDNRGRFSSTGATARGGRLATASGNKRATQTAKLSGGGPKGTVGKPKGLKPGAIKAKPQVSSERQAATDRLKVKTQTRRAMRADRGSVVTPGQRSRLEAGKGATMKGARPASTVAKTRTTGNTKQQVASRVERKLAAERAKMNIINRAERVGATQGSQRERSYKRQATLERAQTFLKTGKLPGKDNSIAAQRSMRQAKERLAAKNAARASASSRASQMRARAAQLDQRGNALMSGGRRDSAAVNVSLNSRARRNETNAGFRGLEMSRSAERLRNRADRVEFRSEQSRAKKLRDVHVGNIAKAKGISKKQVESALKAQPPSVQIKALKNWVRDNRKGARK